MSVADLKIRLADVPGIETLTSKLFLGRMVFEFNGLIAGTDPLATDQEIEDAIRKTADLAKFGRAPDEKTPLPPVGLMPAQTKQGNQMSSGTGASHASLKLKDLMNAHKERIAAMLDDGMAKVQAGFDKQLQGATALGKLGDKVNAEGDDILSTVGQFTNDLGLD